MLSTFQRFIFTACVCLAGTYSGSVAAQVTANFSISFSGNGCQGESVAFQNQSTGASNYLWDFGDLNSSTASNPNHAYSTPGTFNVVLTAWNGLGDTSVHMEPVVVLPTASATIFPDLNPVCAGVPVTFLFEHSPAISNIDWDFGDGFSSTDINPQHAFAAVGDYEVSLEISGACGSDTSTHTIFVQPDAPPQANFDAVPNHVCPGQPVNFVNVSGNGAVAYEWHFDDGNSSTLVNPVHTFDSVGGYDIVLIAFSACGSDTVTSYLPQSGDTLPSFVVVDDGIQPQLTLNASPLQICPAETVQFLATGEGLASHHWDFGDGTTSNQPEVGHNYSAAGSYQVLHTTYNYCGIGIVDSLTILVDSSAVPTAGFTQLAEVVCPGDQVQFVSNALQADSIIWDFGDASSVASGTSVSHSYQAIGTYNIMQVVTNACGNSDTTFSSVEVSSAIVPQATFTTEPAGNLCPGDNIQFVNLTMAADSFVWDFDDGFTSTQTNPQHQFSIVANHAVALIATNGCGNSDTSSQVVVIANNFTPDASAAAQPTTACPGAEVQFQNLSTYAGTASWNFGDGASSATQNPVHIFDSAGIYTATLVLTTGCGVDSATVQVEVIQTIEPTFSVQGLCSTGVTHFSDNTPGSPGFWVWDFGDGLSAQTMNPIHNYADSGTYAVSMQVFVEGCSAEIVDTVQIVDPGTTAAITIQSMPPTCPDSCDGTANIAVAGATGPVTFIWQNGIVGDSVYALCSGEIGVSIADGDGCLYLASDSISNPAPPAMSASIQGATCTAADGQIAITVSGDASPYTFLWDDPAAQTTATATGLAVGNFQVIISDSAGCTYIETVAVPDSGDLQIADFVVQSVSCHGDSNGIATMQISGGTTPFTFGWNDLALQTTQTATALAPGNYSATVTDSNGCIDFALVNVPEPSPLSLFMSATNNVFNNNGTATATVAGGTEPYTWLWDDPMQQATQTATGLGEGTYNVVVLDSNSCSVADSVTVVSTGVGEVSKNQVVMYPNPASETVFIAVGHNSQFQIFVADLTGRIVHKQLSTGTAKLDIAELPAGTYLVTILSKSGIPDVRKLTLVD